MIPSSFQINELLPFFLALAWIGLLFSIGTEHSQLIAKMRGAHSGNVATGYSLAMKIMIFNRVGTILFMFFLGLSIDLGIDNKIILIIAGTVALSLSFYNLILLKYRCQILNYDPALLSSRTNITGYLNYFKKKLLFASFFATLFNILGLTLPLLLSNNYPEYRLSLANTGFLLNSFFTLITVFILEAHIAQIIDKGTEEEAFAFASMIFITRFFALLVAATLFFYLIFFVF